MNILATDNSIERNGGLVWHRLHNEREHICEELLKAEGRAQPISDQDAINAYRWRRELLQSRLHKVDDALDRLLSGSYGNCSQCGRWIQDNKLDFDPAIEFCIDCWEQKQTKH